MRISDWSSDVCSSDLPGPRRPVVVRPSRRPGRRWRCENAAREPGVDIIACLRSPDRRHPGGHDDLLAWRQLHHLARGDRKSVVWGKSVSVRVDLGGRRVIKKKKRYIRYM